MVITSVVATGIAVTFLVCTVTSITGQRGDETANSRMMNGEALHSLSTIAATLPGHRGNAHANASTVFRWIQKGVRTATGELIRLEAVRIGASWRTSHEAVVRFSERLTAATTATPELAPAPESPTQRVRRQAAASAELEQLLAPKRGS